MKMELKGNNDSIESWQEVNLIYNAALRQIKTKMEILNQEFQHVHQYNPIEHIKARIKTPESIVKKLKRHGLESTIENMITDINDIAGVRIICSFTSDIYRIADMIRNQKDIQVIGVKDYITYPKVSGYRSYHIQIVTMTENGRELPAEIQIRTIAIDFWATLEHQLKYKKDIPNEKLIRSELKRCADEIASTDLSMQTIRDIIRDSAKQDM